MDKDDNAKNEELHHLDKLIGGEGCTRYGEFISSYFAWISLPNQKERAEELNNMTKGENDKNKRKNEK